jgi:hypothetical protein
MPEESYEMTRSQSRTSSSTADHHNEAFDSREEEAQLLNKEDQSDLDLDDEDEEDLEEDDETWAIIVEETGADNGRDYEKVFLSIHKHTREREKKLMIYIIG